MNTWKGHNKNYFTDSPKARLYDTRHTHTHTHTHTKGQTILSCTRLNHSNCLQHWLPQFSQFEGGLPIFLQFCKSQASSAHPSCHFCKLPDGRGWWFSRVQMLCVKSCGNMMNFVGIFSSFQVWNSQATVYALMRVRAKTAKHGRRQSHPAVQRYNLICSADSANYQTDWSA